MASTLVALLVAEWAASALAGGAYTFLNLFVADPRYGVKLRPNASSRVRSRDGRVTTIATNSTGFRGPEWPETGDSPSGRPRPRRVLVLGDSQVLGFGVEQEDSFAGRMDALAAAVPSWGPHESVMALEELAPVHRPAIVIFVANVANDWMEADVPNRRRTTAEDGWAVRFVPGRPEPAAFPGREWILGRSHLYLAARRLFAHTAGHSPARAELARDLIVGLPRLGAPRGGHRSRLTRHLLRAARVCARLDCRLIAATLPLDVQVSPHEWAKYGTWPRPTVATERLASDFLADARDAGIEGVDLLPALRRASPGAFLPDDYHLSPRGHRAVARALTEVLR